jgi:hypothetical protein
MEIDHPDSLAEVTAAFRAYEQALMGNDPTALIGFFWENGKTVRYGIAENLHGIAEIAAYRRAQAAAGGYRARQLDRTVITTFGRDFATASTTYLRDDGRMGRQMQTWARFPEGWRIVAAHVSLLAVAG